MTVETQQLEQIEQVEKLETCLQIALNDDVKEAQKQLVVSDEAALQPPAPTDQEVTRYINESSEYIEEVFKCILRGISNSKLKMVKTGTNAPSILEVVEEEAEEEDDKEIDENKKQEKGEQEPEKGEQEQEENALVLTSENNNISKSTDTKADNMTTLVQLVKKLDYFIDIMCNIKSEDAKDMYSVIVLYEKMIFDLRSEISSLSKSLNIYETIIGKK